MKKKLALLIALAFYVSILPPLSSADLIKGNFSDIITKGPWVDVRASQSGLAGAVLDGVTDDSAAFIRSVNAATPNGTVVIPGTMAIGSNGWTGINLTGLSNVTIMGINGGGIKLLFLPSQTYTNYSSIVALKISNSTGVTVRDLDFDGNNLKSGLLGFDNVADSSVIHNTFHTLEYNDVARPLMTSDAGTRNKYLYNDFKGGCYQLVVGLNSAGMEYHSKVALNTFKNPRGCLSAGMRYGSISGNTFNGCDAGLNLGTSVSFPSYGVSVVGNDAFNCADNSTGSPGYGAGFRTDGAAGLNGAYGLTFTGNTVDNCSIGISLSGIGHSSVSGNTLRYVDQGISVGLGTGLSLNSNTITGGRGYDNNYAGINLSVSGSIISSVISIVGNSIINFSLSTQAAILFQETATSYYKNVNISGNVLDNNYNGIYVFAYGDYYNVSNNIITNGTTDIQTAIESGTFYGVNNIYTGSTNLTSPMKYKLNAKTLSNGTAAPTDNTVACAVGDIVWNTANDNVLGWKCTTAGSPGTWKSMSVVFP